MFFLFRNGSRIAVAVERFFNGCLLGLTEAVSPQARAENIRRRAPKYFELLATQITVPQKIIHAPSCKSCGDKQFIIRGPKKMSGWCVAHTLLYAE